MCTDKCGYSCLLVLPTLRNTAPNTCSKCLPSCHFSWAFAGLFFFPHKAGRSCREQTDTAHCFTPLTWSPAMLCLAQSGLLFAFPTFPTQTFLTQHRSPGAELCTCRAKRNLCLAKTSPDATCTGKSE